MRDREQEGDEETGWPDEDRVEQRRADLGAGAARYDQRRPAGLDRVRDQAAAG